VSLDPVNVCGHGTIRPDEARIIRRCADAVLSMTKVHVREIARDLRNDGILTADGKQ